MQAFLALNGKFCLSDDSHGVEQVALNYNKILPFLQRVGISSLSFLRRGDGISATSPDNRFPFLSTGHVDVAELQ